MMPRRPQIVRILGLLVLAGSVSACSRPVALTLRGEPGMNRGGNAATVRIYQLSNNAGFERASIDALWRSDEAIARDLVGRREEIVIYPEQTQTLEMTLNKETRFIGIAANLREPFANAWREIYAVDRIRGRDITVIIGDDRIEIVGRRP
jgi:type VI secretion system VasD/TssJ family lipoprotein